MNDKLAMLPRMMKNAQPIAFYAAASRARPLLKPFANASPLEKYCQQRCQTYNVPHERDDTTPEYFFHHRTVGRTSWAISYRLALRASLLAVPELTAPFTTHDLLSAEHSWL